MVAVSALAAVVVALFAAVPAFADVLREEPGHSKSATFDPATGKIKITLSVTGDTDTSESKSSANLIVVLDTSGSMNDIVARGYVKDNNNGRYGLVDGKYVNLYYSYSSGKIYYNDGQNYIEYTGDRYRYGNKTRLDVAKEALGNLADQLIGQDSTVKISLETYSTYGNKPSEYYHGGQSAIFKGLVNKLTAEGGTNWTDALARANKKAEEDTSTPTYIVFLSDGKPTYTMTKDGSLDGNGSESQSNERISGFVTDAVTTANDRPKNVMGFYAIYTGSDAANSMHSFALRTNASPNRLAIDGSDSDALQSAFSNIVQTIKTGISYTNVEITDTKSDYVDYVLPDGKTPEFTYTYTKDGKPWTEENVPNATFDKDKGQVSWNLGTRKLEKGVTYSVSFEVTLTQDTYDKAALGELPNTDNTVPTNGNATLWYSTVITTDGNDSTPTKPTSIDIPSPTVTVPTSTLHISKTWNKNGWDKVNLPNNEITVQVMQDNEDNKYYNYKTVTLKASDNASDNWSADVVVAAGPTGHTYTVKEENAPAGWEATLDPNDGVELEGLTSLKRDQTITNTIKTAKLTITKSVTGNFGDTSKDFSFKLTDASGNAITNVKPVSTDVSLGSDGRSFKLKHGEKLVVELPYGTAYKVVEDNSNDSNDTKYDTSISVDGEKVVTKDASYIAKDGITKDTTITYTNYREVKPDVGVDLGSGAPYAAVFGGAGLAGVIWMVLKRRNSLGI